MFFKGGGGKHLGEKNKDAGTLSQDKNLIFIIYILLHINL